MKSLNNTREVILHTKHYVHGRTLDFGAGTAKYQHLIRPHTGSYTTFDMVPGKNIDIVGDGLNPPFKDGEFDTVVSTQVLEHVEKPWVMIAQIGRIIKSGGICIITAPFIVPFHADPYDFFRYTETGLTSMFKNENFEIVESGTYGRVFGVLSEMAHFSWFSPYEERGKKSWSRKIVMRMEKVARFLDKFVKNKVIYSNVYVVAKKK
jgi:SAM-dependent methyltransferase